MVLTKNLVLAALSGLAMALPEPHKGMIDNAHVRDVGVVFSKPDFQGDSKFILEMKDTPECLPINGDVSSIKICKEDVRCIFYTGGNCEPGNDNYAVAVLCGDAARVETPRTNHFGYYRCGKPEMLGQSDWTVPTVPHEGGVEDVGPMRI